MSALKIVSHFVISLSIAVCFPSLPSASHGHILFLLRCQKQLHKCYFSLDTYSFLSTMGILPWKPYYAMPANVICPASPKILSSSLLELIHPLKCRIHVPWSLRRRSQRAGSLTVSCCSFPTEIHIIPSTEERGSLVPCYKVQSNSQWQGTEGPRPRPAPPGTW